MCGVAAILQTDGAPVNEWALQQMTNRMIHRGPDGGGTYTKGSIGLGHRRLSVIDPKGGDQPLCNEDKTVWLTFNGEIYNYQELQRDLIRRGHHFRTNSDTETIVHAYEEWGINCLARFRGMFAIAIWDEKRRQLFLARDRFGIKPLIYWQQSGLFAVASEMQALQSHPEFDGTIDLASIDLFLHYQYIPAPHSIYREVHKLPPAHYLVVYADGSHSAPVRYWDFSFQPDRSLNETAWIERLDAALQETIATHLVSDVPFGVFLSGGLDSSTVLAYMHRELQSSVQAFTVGHSSPDYDERNWAAEAAKACGAEHFIETVEPDAMELLPTLVKHFGEPFADSSAVATYFVSRLARQHVKMVLSGDGGDELFAGYHSYPAILWQADPAIGLARRGKRWLADQLRAAGLWPPRLQSSDHKYSRTAVVPADVRRSLWRPELADHERETRREFDREFSAQSSDCLLSRLQRYDIRNYIAYDNLTKVDCASMCHGLEVRVPLLDHIFLETVSKLPPELRLRSVTTSGSRRGRFVPGEPLIGKYAMKKNAERFFSLEFIHRHKRGFEVPVQDWFCGPHQEELKRRLTGRDSLLHEYFQEQPLNRIFEQAARDRTSAWQGWSLLVLEEWLQQARTVHSSVSSA